MKRAVALLCIALCVSAASAADSKFPSTWISDYLSSTKASVMSGYYEETEKATMCFRTGLYCAPGYTTPGQTQQYQELDTLICSPCPEDIHYRKYEHDSDDFAIGDMPSALGKCMFTKTEQGRSTDVPILGKPGFNWAGTFYGTCQLDKSGKDVCELPEGCEGTTLTVQGTIYRVTNAVQVGPDESSANDCSDLRKVAPRHGEAPTEKKDTATVQYAKEYYYEQNVVPKQVPVGEAMVYDGTFTVFGSHANKWKEGRFQYSWIGTTTQTNLEETLDYPRLGDDVYKLEFVGGSKGRY